MHTTPADHAGGASASTHIIPRATRETTDRPSLDDWQQAPFLAGKLINALWLYDRGVNVIPLPYGEKKPDYRWRRLMTTRLPRAGVIELFPPYSNLAAITGRTSGGLFSIDCDSPLAYKLTLQFFLDRNLPILATVSTRGADGAPTGHILGRCADGVIENADYSLVADGFTRADGDQPIAVNILGHDKLAVLPPSYNAQRGREYRWRETGAGDLTPAVDDIPVYSLDLLRELLPGLALFRPTRTSSGRDYGLTALEAECARVATAEIGARNNTLNLAAHAIGQLIAGGEVHYYDAQFALTQAGIAAGLSAAEVRATVDSGLNAGMESPRRRPVNRPQHGRTPERARLQAAIDRYDWRQLGRVATTTRAVVSALSQRAGTAQRGVFRASEREIAELARVSRVTARAALVRAVNLGFVQRAGTDTGSGATLWRIGELARQQAQDRETDPLPTLASSSGSISRSLASSHGLPEDHDARERGVFGKNGWLVWCWLVGQAEPRTTRAIATSLNLTVSQVRHAINRVIEHSPAGYPLIANMPTGWMASPMHGAALRDYVTLPAGADGRGAERREKHAAERQQRAYLDVRDRVRRWPSYVQHVRTMLDMGTINGPAPVVVDLQPIAVRRDQPAETVETGRQNAPERAPAGDRAPADTSGAGWLDQRVERGKTKTAYQGGGGWNRHDST